MSRFDFPLPAPHPAGRWRGLLLLLVFCALCALPPAVAFAAPPTPPLVPPENAAFANQLQALNRAATGVVTVSRHPTTGAIRLLQVNKAGDLLPTVAYVQGKGRADQLTAKSAQFFARYGALFGLVDPATELRYVEARESSYAYTDLTYQQYYQGVPIFGGTLRTHFDAAGRLTAVNGIAVPIEQFNPLPDLSAADAVVAALALVKADVPTQSNGLRAAATDLYVLQPALLKGSTGPLYLTYRVEVVNANYSVRRFVFVDAHSGKEVLTLNGVHEIEREISEGSLGNKVWDEGNGNPDPIPSGWASGNAAQVTAWNDEIAGAKETYNLFGSLTNGSWLSYDSNNAVMRTVNNDPTIQCPNANWNSISTNYCNGVTGDDTVAHEWGHAYTEYTSNLIYKWQPGALNEAYSDIWGEVVDLLNNRGTDTPNTPRTAGSCSTRGVGAPATDNSYRWLSGEDDPAFGGAIRDMWNPVCYGDPGKVTDSQYTCDVQFKDDGGVHRNSGVPNHLFALLVDGGTYNNITVAAIGLTRAAHLHWRAQSAYLTEASDFAAQADALSAACTDLIGEQLYTLTTNGPGSWGTIAPETINAAHCTAVANAIAAVELRTPPSQCDLSPLLNPNAPPLCTAPQVATAFHTQRWENGLAGWTVGRELIAQPNQFSIPNWSIVGNLPDGRAGQAAFGPAPFDNGDQCQTLDESGVTYLQSPVLTVPTYATSPRLTFDHWIATEVGWDGGNLKIRVNGGGWTTVPATDLTFNGYNRNLNTTDNTNPLAGEPAFSGSNNSGVRGSWGQTQVNLDSYANPGDTVELRFALGFDGCNGLVGWYVDDLQAYACTAPPDLDITKTAAVSTALPGQPVTYQLTVNNLSSLPASDLTITDRLPTGLTATAFSLGGTLVTNPAPAVVWSFDTLGGSQPRTLTVTAVVSPALTTDLSLTNTALVSATGDTNTENNTATRTVAVTVPRVGLTQNTRSVDEGVGQFPITVTLNSPNPYAPVQVTYATANNSATAGADYATATGTVTIPPGATTALIGVTLVNDSLPEAQETFRLQLSGAVGASVTQNLLEITIVDDDTPGISLQPVTNQTGEDGGTADLRVALKTQPAAAVAVTLSSSDPTEGVVTAPLDFTPQNWNVSQTVTVSGVDDGVDDGDISYTITATATSSDPDYAALAPVAVTLTNRDNDVALLRVAKRVAAPAVAIGSVVTYTYVITNAGNVALSQLSAVDDRLGPVALTVNNLAPNAATSAQLTHVLTVADLPILVNRVTVNGLSTGGNQIVGKAQATLKLLDVDIVLTKTVGILGIGPACAQTDRLPVPVGTPVYYCYQVENRGSIALPSHRLVDDRLGIVLEATNLALAPGAIYSTGITTTPTVSNTNVATWTSSFPYTVTLPNGQLFSKVLTIAAQDSATVTVASATDDRDGDTIPDNVEGAGDGDGDQLPNFLDPDADNDGLSDQQEAGPDPRNPRDSNNNGIADYLESATAARRIFLPLLFR